MQASRLIKILIPIGIWVLIFSQYFLGAPAMTRHGIDYYHIIHYTMDNLSRGVLPLWEPFAFMGRPAVLDLRFIGEFNPFLWVYSFLRVFHLPLTLSYLFYSVLYHFLGLFGFYLLAKRFFKNENWAILSFVLLMFSSLTIPIFNNYCITLLFVPCMWFFYYLYVLLEQPKRSYLLGLTFSSMIIAITYMPFYFLTIFLTVTLFSILFFPQKIWKLLRGLGKFLFSNKFLVLFCVAAVLCSTIPGILWYLENQTGDFVVSIRQSGSADTQTASMAFEMLHAGSIVGPVTLRGLFSGLEGFLHPLFYMSFFIYIIGLCAALNRITKRSVVLLASGTVIFLIIVTNVSPFLKFLYSHVFYFKLIRNLFYMMYMSFPLLILFAVEQLRLFVENEPKTTWGKAGMVLFVVLAHLGLFAFVHSQGDIIATTYLTLLLSLVFFSLYFLGMINRNKPIFIYGLLILVMLQPIEVFCHYVKNGRGVVEWFPKEKFYPKFSFIRPYSKEENLYYGKGIMTRDPQDLSGYVDSRYTGMKWPWELQQNVNRKVLEEYTQHKFVIYDNVETVSEDYVNFKRMERFLQNKKNTVMLFTNHEFSMVRRTERPEWQGIKENSKELEVLKFDLNEIKIKTNFNEGKFLVYNDAFHKDWRAVLNGKKTDLFRANYAFKGVWLPAGENVLDFKFGSPMLHIFFFFLFVLFFGVLGFLIRQTLTDGDLENG